MDLPKRFVSVLVAVLVIMLGHSVGHAQLFKRFQQNQQCTNCQPVLETVQTITTLPPVVTHIHPVPQPAPQLSTVVQSSAVVVSSVVDQASVQANSRAQFRRVFLAAAKSAKQSGALIFHEKETAKDAELRFARLVIVSLRPAQLEKIQAFAHESAIQEGLATPAAVDWDAIIEFIEKLIPLIIKLIELF